MNRRTHIAWISVVIIITVYFIACTKADPEPVPQSPQPVPVTPLPPVAGINSFYPQTATAGDPVKITGKNLSTVSVVSFGGTSAQSFTVISDSVIIASVSAGSASGNVVVTTAAGNPVMPGFVYYTPQSFFLSGNCKRGNIGIPSVWYPGIDSSKYKEVITTDTCSFALRKINPNDFERNLTSLGFTQSTYSIRSRYVDSPNYAILSGVAWESTPYTTPANMDVLYKFNSQAVPGSSVFVKIQDTLITIPKQTPLSAYVSIKGSGVIKDGVITITCFMDDSHGNSKTFTYKSQ